MVINVQLNKATTMRKVYRKPELEVVTIARRLLQTTSYIKTGEYQGGIIQAKESSFGGWDDDVEPGEDY